MLFLEKAEPTADLALLSWMVCLPAEPDFGSSTQYFGQ